MDRMHRIKTGKAISDFKSEISNRKSKIKNSSYPVYPVHPC
jgi:hypothetical protein